MNSFKSLAILVVTSLTLGACETQMIDKIDDLNLENGGYMRMIEFPVPTFSVSKANMGGTKMEFTAEAVTPDKGALFSSYDLVIRFVDTTPANGDKTTTAKNLKSIPASAYAKDPTTGYPRAKIAVTGTEALTATGLTAADVSAGDRFEITGTMRLTNGRAFTNTNSSSDLLAGPFYNSTFFYRVGVVQ